MIELTSQKEFYLSIMDNIQGQTHASLLRQKEEYIYGVHVHAFSNICVKHRYYISKME